MKSEITETAKKQLEIITTYINKHGYAPSIAELTKLMGYSSTSTTQHNMDRLFYLGYLETDIEINGTRPPRAYRLGKRLRK